jgi:succinate dehydrogenase / fumarate reductase membrane anchor subunit
MIVRYRTSHAAATGLGVAGHGTGHWRAQRVSAIALIPLVLWFALSVAGGAAADYPSITGWLGTSVNGVLMILLVIAAFHHAALGLQVIVEDYIHSRVRFAMIALVQLLCILGAAADVIATLAVMLKP